MGSRLEKGADSTRKRIESHKFEDEEGEEYEGSKFGGFSDYFRRKKIKLQNLDAQVRSASVGKLQIFRGVVAHVNGYTQPSLNDLHHLIVSHGGGFMQYLDGKTTVTHIIAASLTPRKAIEFRKYRIVKPAWIVDSVKQGKLLPWDSYRVLDEGSGQRILGFDEGKIVSQSNTQQRGYRDQTNASWYNSQVKVVAEDIDDADGAQFPSTQAVTLNGQGDFKGGPSEKANQFNDNTSDRQRPINEEDPSSSNCFEVTSSLEDAFNDVVAEVEPAQKPAATLPSPLLDQDLSDVLPDNNKNDTFPAGPSEAIAPSKSEGLVNLKKRPFDEEMPSPSKKGEVVTAEEHNARLLADPHMRKSSTANPDFIKQYYSESRLHHLSTWKAELKARFQRMAEDKTASQKQKAKRKPGSRRYIMHVDFDSFFCAVSLKSAPEYVDKPTVVAHGSGPGSEIASCNYPARTFGVTNGMWMKKALQLCPDIKVLPYDFPAYEVASNAFYESIIDVGGIVQSVSIDEALVDISALCLPAGGTDGVVIREGSIWREQTRADEIAQGLRTKIKEITGCEVSIGIGGNILLAKVALRKAKPAGQHQIKPEEILDFIGELNVTSLPGIASSIGGKLEEIGVKLVKEARLLTKERLMSVLGPKTGEKIWDYSRGIDRTEVGEQVVRKSVSAEVNWGIRFTSQPEAEEFVQNLCIELQRRLLDQRVKGRQFTMKIMRKAADAPLDPPKNLGHGKCDTFNKSIVLGVATNSADIIGREAVSILRSYGFSPGELRGLGVQMTKLEPLKTPNVSMPDGSQRRINFGTSAAPKLSKQPTEDPIDDPETPEKPKAAPISCEPSKGRQDGIASTPQKPKTLTPYTSISDDPIDDDSPQKPKATPIHPAAAIARANAADQSAKKLLNLTGTQFIIPTQIDPEVLAELPLDIRAKLMAQSKTVSKKKPVSREISPAINSLPKSRSNSPACALPSQLDPEVFEALPEDMKAEVLASYSAAGPGPSRSRQQSLMPQSPRKPRPLPPKKTTPTKPRRGRPLGALNKKNKGDPYSTLTQSNFVASKGLAGESSKSKPGPNRTRSNNDDDDNDNEEEEKEEGDLDPEFLSALPPELRAELIAEHRRARLLKRGALSLGTTKKVKRRPPDPVPAIQRRLRLPPRDARPTFTTRELSTLSELRETLSAWFEEFRGEGPHPDDVGAMERYLRRVVLEERDVGKVVGVVKWLGWLVDCSDDENGGSGNGSEGLKIWTRALEGIKRKVQDAVKERGLGRLEL
jgi:DNA repair protein REV1